MIGWPCAIYFEKGHLFEGTGFGAKVSCGGEVVFNTGLTGYQEIFTDPSYCEQIVVMTHPHIGNTGINFEDPESGGMNLSGVAVRDYTPFPSSWRSKTTLSDYLKDAKVPGIFDVDTRVMTQIIRDEGAQRSIIFPTENVKSQSLLAHAKAQLESVSSMEGLELVSRVSTKTAYEFKIEGEVPAATRTMVVYDYGVKKNILRHLRRRGFRVWVVPYQTPAQDVLALKPAGVVLSNGPGDPETVRGAVEEIQKLVGKVPILAICMGHQLLARAMGSKTHKLKFGHHGCNHPVKDVIANRILITSQNHGFAVASEEISKLKDVRLSHINLNDRTVEGFVSEKMKFYSVQFHPEAGPGPSDASYIFDYFLRGFVQ